jgi:hypothetical protein
MQLPMLSVKPSFTYNHSPDLDVDIKDWDTVDVAGHIPMFCLKRGEAQFVLTTSGWNSVKPNTVSGNFRNCSATRLS